MTDEKTRAGYVALIGRPNVGKSTLLNHFVGQKLSITSPRPQTTRHTLLGILTRDDTQIVFVDTPGLHANAPRAVNRMMNRAAGGALEFVDVVVLVVEAQRWTPEDDHVLEVVKRFQGPVILALNKIDRLDDKKALLPIIEAMATRHGFAEIVPVSASREDGLDRLEAAISERLPYGPFSFEPDQVTTASVRFLAAEIIREKLFRRLHDEVPYALTVTIEGFEDTPTLTRIQAVIWVERPGQKAIVIGQGGTNLREVGRQARLDLEAMLERKVFLQTWVKVREGWSDDESALRSFGLDTGQE